MSVPAPKTLANAGAGIAALTPYRMLHVYTSVLYIMCR